MEITNGYVFRQLFEIYDRLVVNVIPIYFKETGVTIRTGIIDNGKEIISDMEIFTDDIIYYYLNTALSTIPKNKKNKACHVEQFNINKLKNIFKSISKSNSVRIFKLKDNEDISIEIKGLTIERSYLPKVSYQLIENDISHLNNDKIPNAKVDINQFCTTMKAMSRGDVDIIIFKVYKHGLLIVGKNNNNENIKSSSWGIIGNNCYETKMNINIIKALCKISGTTFYSIIKVYSNKDGELKLTHKISDFGEHTIFLLDNFKNLP